MKLCLSLIACALLCACAGVPMPPPCPAADLPIATGDRTEVSAAASALIETCLPPEGKGMLVRCDQAYLERLIEAINGGGAK